MLCTYRANREVCIRSVGHDGGHVLASDSASDRFLALAERFPVDAELRARIESHRDEPLPLGHHFVGVAGHPDDDECTYRSDGTDQTYCGANESRHYWVEVTD